MKLEYLRTAMSNGGSSSSGDMREGASRADQNFSCESYSGSTSTTTLPSSQALLTRSSKVDRSDDFNTITLALSGFVVIWPKFIRRALSTIDGSVPAKYTASLTLPGFPGPSMTGSLEHDTAMESIAKIMIDSLLIFFQEVKLFYCKLECLVKLSEYGHLDCLLAEIIDLRPLGESG